MLIQIRPLICSSAPTATIRVRYCPSFCVFVVMMTVAACASGVPPPDPEAQVPSTVTVGPTEGCPVAESRHWQAWVDRPDGVGGEARLNLFGQVDLPTPGYSVTLSQGPLDRRNPPSLRVLLSASRPDTDGMVIQMISSEDVEFRMPSPVLEYRSIMITCGTRVLAELPDVRLAD